MASTPSRVADRLSAGLKRFQPVIASAKARDVNESDTVMIVTDMLSEMFGYDKYAEITSEYVVRGTFVDLAIKLDNHVQFLVEAKAIGLELKESYTKQAIDYAANLGVEWVILTNGELWRVYRVTLGKAIEQEQVIELSIPQLSHKRKEDIDLLYHLSREGWLKSSLGDFHTQKQALGRHVIAALVLSDAVVDVIRRELRRLAPDTKVESERIRDVLLQDVLKRDAIEGEKADEARKRIHRAANKALRKQSKSGAETESDLEEPVSAEDSEEPLPGEETTA